jgi:hypothetical protein
MPKVTGNRDASVYWIRLAAAHDSRLGFLRMNKLMINELQENRFVSVMVFGLSKKILKLRL